MLIYTFLLISTIYLYVFVKNRLRFKKLINKFPGRTDGHRILGDIRRFTPKSDEIFAEFREFNRLFPNCYKIWTPWFAVICITKPEYIEILLRDVRYIKKSLLYDHLHIWLKTGLLTSTGEKWAQRRKLLTPAFHFNILKKLAENFSEHNQYLLELLKKEVNNKKTNIVPIISHVALNIICGTSMGVSLNNEDKKNMNYRQALYTIPGIINFRATHPLYLFNLPFLFHPLYQELNKQVSTIHTFTKEIIQRREEEFDENEVNYNEETYSKKKLAMLDHLLNAKRKRGEIDDEGIREEVDTFTFEGHDTVSSAICFALMLIANNKQHQKKIIQELDETFGDSNRDITFQDLQNLPYLELCLKECLRLYPSVPLISRHAEHEIELDDKYTIPKGSLIHVHIYDLHRNPNLYPDPEKFIPERFLQDNCKNRHPYAYIPFSAGPRNCIGQKYAMYEMKSIVATILRHYELEPIDTPKTVILCLEMVLRSKNGIHVKIVPRNK